MNFKKISLSLLSLYAGTFSTLKPMQDSCALTPEEEAQFKIKSIQIIKSFTQSYKGPHGEYPQRVFVPEHLRSWDVEHPEYQPATAKNSPQLVEMRKKIEKESWYESEPDRDQKELSKNHLFPGGRTGIDDAGALGKRKKNKAADPVVTLCLNNKIYIKFIKRADNNQWALPGGMVDPQDDKLSRTAAREFQEETGHALNMDDAAEIYSGPVDDWRNTDRRWITTKVYHKHLTAEEAAALMKQKVGYVDPQEIRTSEWIAEDDERLNNLFASHAEFVAMGIKRAKALEKRRSECAQLKEAFEKAHRASIY